jgi:hypothetical protein
MLNPKQLDLTKDIVMSGGNIYLSSGSASTPALLFNDHTNTGIYLVSNAKIGISTSGVQRFFINTASVTSNLQVRSITGSASSPSYAFTNALNTGLFLDNSENTLTPSLALSVNGNSGLTLQSDLTIIAEGNTAIRIPTGSTLNRPSTAETGMIRYNSDVSNVETYNGTNWIDVQLQQSGVINNFKIVTSDYTAQINDYYIFANAVESDISITLPFGTQGTTYIVKRISSTDYTVKICPPSPNSTFEDASSTTKDASSTTVDASLYDVMPTIDGNSFVVINNQFTSYTITTDGNNWYIV